jgi:hypothetical protein
VTNRNAPCRLGGAASGRDALPNEVISQLATAASLHCWAIHTAVFASDGKAALRRSSASTDKRKWNNEKDYFCGVLDSEVLTDVQTRGVMDGEARWDFFWSSSPPRSSAPSPSCSHSC